MRKPTTSTSMKRLQALCAPCFRAEAASFVALGILALEPSRDEETTTT